MMNTNPRATASMFTSLEALPPELFSFSQAGRIDPSKVETLLLPDEAAWSRHFELDVPLSELLEAAASGAAYK